MSDFIENMQSVPRGAEGLGIGEQYPVAEYGVPGPGTGSATWSELGEAGFDRPLGAEPTLVDDDGTVHVLHFFVLRDADGGIVATWDEGRWWTPAESEAFTAVLGSPVVRRMAEATASLSGNRAQRRRRQK